MARAKQPVSIDGIEFDALIDQSVDYSAEVPEYPTEKGFSVSDTIVLKPETISMTLFVTDTPVTWKQRFGSGSGRVQNVVKRLEELYFSKKVISIVTSDAVYDNMAITSISIVKNTSSGYAREIPISFKKIVVTESSTVTIPDSYGKSGASGASAGSASTSTVSSGGGSSGSSSGSSGSGSSSSGSSGGSSGGSGGGSKGSILYQAASGFGLI